MKSTEKRKRKAKNSSKQRIDCFMFWLNDKVGKKEIVYKSKPLD